MLFNFNTLCLTLGQNNGITGLIKSGIGLMMSWDKISIQQGLAGLRHKYGEWSYDIPLPLGIWTKGNLQIPHTRLRRVVQIINDIVKKPLSECRILDLGCLDGIFSIEFARQGAETVGVEIREANIKKAIFCKDVLGLNNLDFRQDDVRNISLERYGRFDAIICSGILYHLPAMDAIALINTMFEIVDRVVVIDTNIACVPKERIIDNGEEYWGHRFREHSDKATPEEKAKALWASADNPISFWFTRPSLINILSQVGFSSIHECFVPAHLNFGRPGIESKTRCTFVAIKDNVCQICTSPIVNSLNEKWPEKSLSYAKGNPIAKRAIAKFRRLINKEGHGIKPFKRRAR